MEKDATLILQKRIFATIMDISFHCTSMMGQRRSICNLAQDYRSRIEGFAWIVGIANGTFDRAWSRRQCAFERNQSEALSIEWDRRRFRGFFPSLQPKLDRLGRNPPTNASR
jgi:hypothetical protein